MEIGLVYNRKLITTVSMEELRILIKRYKGKLPYKVVLTTDNNQDIQRFEQLKIPYVLDWRGKWS